MNDVLRLFKEKKAEEDFLNYHTRRRQAECRNAAPSEEVSTAAPSSSRKPVNQRAISDESAGSTASLSRFDSDLDDLARSILRRIFSAGCSTSFQESSAARKAASRVKGNLLPPFRKWLSEYGAGRSTVIVCRNIAANVIATRK
jgi:hypothetical protein